MRRAGYNRRRTDHEGPVDRLFNHGVFRRLLKNASFLLGAGGVVSGVRLLQGVLVARALGTADFGLLAMVMAYVDIVVRVIDCRAWEAGTKYISEFWVAGEREKSLATLGLCYIVDLGTGIVAFGVVVASSGMAARVLYHRPELSGLMVLYGLSQLLLTVNSTSSAVLRVFDRYKLLSGYDVGNAAGTCAAVVAFLALGWGMQGVVWGCVVAAGVGAVVKNVMALSVASREMELSPRDMRLSPLKGRTGEILKFVVNTNVGSTLGLVIKSVDVVVLGYFRAPTEVGYFKLAKSMVAYLPRLSDPLYIAVYPELAKLWAQRQRDEIAGLLRRASAVVTLAAVPLAAAAFLLAPEVVERAVGAQYLPATVALRIMLPGVLIAMMLFWAHPLSCAIGRPDIPVKVNAVNAALVAGCSVLLVPFFGYLGSAAIFSTQYLTTHVLEIGLIVRDGNGILSRFWTGRPALAPPAAHGGCSGTEGA